MRRPSLLGRFLKSRIDFIKQFTEKKLNPSFWIPVTSILLSMIRFLLCFCLVAFGALGHARAGTVITAGLPSNVEIVNINAQQDGAANYNGGNSGQALWYSPFGTGPNGLLSIPVSPGTYTFRIIDPADAALAYPSLTSEQLSTLYTAWTYNSPYSSQFFVFDLSAATNPSVPQLFDGAGAPAGTPAFFDAQSAYNDAVNGGYANRLRLTSEQSGATPGREGTVFETSYTVTTATSLVFAIPDNGLGDNNGGLSVVVTAVPEPRSFVLLLTAVGLLAAGWRRQRTNKQAVGRRAQA